MSLIKRMDIEQELWSYVSLINMKNVKKEVSTNGNLPDTQTCVKMESVTQGCAGSGKAGWSLMQYDRHNSSTRYVTGSVFT